MVAQRPLCVSLQNTRDMQRQSGISSYVVNFRPPSSKRKGLVGQQGEESEVHQPRPHSPGMATCLPLYVSHLDLSYAFRCLSALLCRTAVLRRSKAYAREQWKEKRRREEDGRKTEGINDGVNFQSLNVLI